MKKPVIIKKLRVLIAGLLSLSLCACSGFFDKDNTLSPTPLTRFTQESSVHPLWNISTGWGAGEGFYTYLPAVTDKAIYTASKNGIVTATNKATGKVLWRINTHTPISAGPAATERLVIIGTRRGTIEALNVMNGKLIWKTRTSSEILAAPAANKDIVLIKAIDGRLSAFSAAEGQMLWNYQQTEPGLILRAASAPQITPEAVVVGFANGNVAKLGLHKGNLLWQQSIAIPNGSFAIQRMIDIDANPVIFNNCVYAVAYQGRIAALDLTSGQPVWTYDLSSYAGLAVDADRIYVTDAKSDIWAFNRNTGKVEWRQTQLEARNVSGPALMGDNLVVGDGEGYLHWLSKHDGHLTARTRMALSAILTAPVVDHNVIYTVAKEGRLAAYSYNH
jgi:outer membrane protein assembly factor BamB